MRASVSVWCVVLLCAAAALASAEAHKLARRGRGHVAVQATADKVKAAIYIESFCPDCKAMLTQFLYPAFQLGLDQIVDLTIVPYGNAHEQQTPSGWNFTCQHGDKECVGNVIETCAIKYYPLIYTHFKFINCIESTDNPVTAAPTCAKAMGLDWDAISACANGAEGNALEHDMAVATESLQPAHTWVPWVTVNDEHNEDWDSNPVAAICAAYKGTNVPEACFRLSVSLYYESYCPGCQETIQLLIPAMANLSAIADFALYPYGNCKRTPTGDGGYNYTCQHGADECLANQYEQCALEFLDAQTANAFILCLEKNGDPVGDAKDCATKTGVDFQEDILDCVAEYGDELQDEFATDTEALDPPHTYVPWFTINGEHSTDAEDDPVAGICKAYKGYQTLPICAH